MKITPMLKIAVMRGWTGGASGKASVYLSPASLWQTMAPSPGFLYGSLPPKKMCWEKDCLEE